MEYGTREKHHIYTKPVPSWVDYGESEDCIYKFRFIEEKYILPVLFFRFSCTPSPVPQYLIKSSDVSPYSG